MLWQFITAIELEIGLSAEILAEGSVRATLLEYARKVGVSPPVAGIREAVSSQRLDARHLGLGSV
ncbi:MAG: hypothetical protein HYY06_13370 [Deltaproteobacteria bacterium]|nr:hypothetical protein [Deltaproteobacteria bacterium]